VYLLALKPKQVTESVLKPPSSLLVKALDGRACSTKDRLLQELAHVFAFPDYFDPNWDALEECLCDLEWLPADGYLLLIRQAERVLCNEPDEWPTLLSVLRSTGKYWGTKQPDRPPRPFHTVFTVEAHLTSSRKNWPIARWKAR
jgi:hypothetical protein